MNCEYLYGIWPSEPMAFGGFLRSGEGFNEFESSRSGDALASIRRVTAHAATSLIAERKRR